MNDNVITFTGWVGSKVEVTEVLEGVQVASFRVGSTPRRFRDGSWEDGETVWYAVKAWRRLAQHVGDSVRTGDPVIVSGRLEAESWTAQDGSPVTRYVVVAACVGHDLAKGTSTFSRPPQQRPVTSQWDVPDGSHEVVGATDAEPTDVAAGVAAPATAEEEAA